MYADFPANFIWRGGSRSSIKFTFKIIEKKLGENNEIISDNCFLCSTCRNEQNKPRVGKVEGCYCDAYHHVANILGWRLF